MELTLPLILLIPLLLCLLLKARAQKPGPALPPGPRPLPILGNLHMLGRLPHRALAKLAQEYGPIMSLRLGSRTPTVVVSTAAAAELFLKRHNAVFASRPPVLQFRRGGAVKDVVFAPYGDCWRHGRKLLLTHLLSAAKVAGFEGSRRAEVEAAVRRLGEAAEAREVVDVGERVGELIEGIVYRMVFGKGREKEEDKKYDMRGVIQEASALIGAFNLLGFSPWLALLGFQGLMRQIKRVRKVTHEMFEIILDDYLKQDDPQKNRGILGMLVSLMHNSTNDFSSFGRANIKALTFDMFVGGSETINVNITWLFSALLKHPRVMKLVQAEVDAIVGRDRTVEESDLSKLTYLDMVIKETFRLYPTGPLLVAHESMEDVIVNGFMIPKKSRVIINKWAIGRDPSIWSENVEEFYPERFIDKNIDVRGHHFELIPFGAGRRICPGILLALTTTKLIIAHLVHCFDWELPNGMQPEELDMSEKFGLSMPRAHKLLAIPCHRI